MKYVKMLGLAAVAAAALMAFVGASTASATTLTGVGGAKLPAGTEIHAVNEGVVKLTTAFKNIECEESTVKGSTENETGATVTGSIAKADLTWGKCNCEVKTLAGGKLHVAVSGTGPNGTVSSSGAEVTAQCTTIFGPVHCIYSTGAGTSLGTLTGSTTTGSTATMDISENNIPRLTTDALCAEKANWDAKYSVTTPDVLNVIS